MPSLQLLQLTERGRNILSSRRKALLLAGGILVAGGTATYLQSRFCRRTPDSFGHYNGVGDNEERPGKGEKDGSNKKKSKQKKGGSNSLKVLAAILLSEMGQMGARNILALVGIVVLRTALSNRLAKVQGFLFRAAFLRRVPLFFRLISENILLCFLLSTMHSTSKFITGTLSLRFRKILTKLIHSCYFENMAYYKISHVDGRITNPEQRIASDVPKFCSELSELVQDDLIAVTDGLLYTWRLCSYASPKYFFWILAYVLGAGGMIRNFSPAFGKLMSKEQQLGGEYRQLHSRLRTHAESIAFYGGENREESHIQKKFKSLTRHMSTVLHDHWWFGMIQDFLLKYLGATVAVVLIIEPFFAGHLRPESSTLGRAEMLSNLRYHTSVIISLFQSLGTLSTSSRKLNRLSGYADRIHELMVISRELSIDDKSSQRNGNRNFFSEANYIEFSGVKVVTPTNNVLVEDLTLKVEPGSNLLITGPNGSGKSSLFRVLGGLWPLVDLEYLLDRYPPEKEVNWGDELSLGEQQRLGMARLFYHKPKFAILDECTSAVTTDMEERFCAKVRAMGTSCITISHRPALVAFHDVVLSLDGEGEWRVHYRRDDTPVITKSVINMSKSSETDRQSDAMAVERAFVMAKKTQSYISEVIAASPSVDHSVPLPIFPQLRSPPRGLPLRVAAMSKVLVSFLSLIRHAASSPINPCVADLLWTPLLLAFQVPTVFDKQGAQLLAVAFLVLSRTWISDRIASLNGTTVKYVLEQDKASFVRLIGVSILQSAASSFIAPSLRHLTARLALGWRIRMTQHLLKNYLRNNAFYKVFNMSSKSIDADQRITQDLEKLTSDLAGLVTGMVKPSVDILWFTWRMKLLTGQRGVAILYVYMFLGLGFLRTVTPDFGDLTSREQQLEGTFRFMHERLRTHAESIAFFGGGSREKAMIDSRFRELLDHSLLLLKKKWLFGILDDFVTKQLPNNVTWGLSLLYALEHKGDRALTSTQGELAHALRFLASVVSQSFLAFGDILELHRKFLELSGGINRIFELEELLDAAQSGTSFSLLSELFFVQKLDSKAYKLVGCPGVDGTNSHSQHNLYSEDAISFSELDIITPAQKLLARRLTCDIVPGKSLLVTGPNGSGKSSVFRVLRGLWPVVSGSLAKPSQHIIEEAGSGCGIFYVPQRPYTCLGTLRDQIIYPLSREGSRAVGIKASWKRDEVGWDADLKWEDTLSLGEQQRLGMARLFFHRPKFGILDECTNATSVDVEEQLYRLAKDMGITFVTSSQRPALIPFHSMELRLIDGEGNWELRKIEQ
ncbi:hypothetical protein Patl1_27241 [Pistacia atlantica]|uniref:Uncharacterized protein n=1 Tax=Pistacia atlantica TaxID=434234 RepID=A0ACC1BDK5_9ROSI|nr:hypothetical protein Patl1_27241 [Pistacia atlantica]